MLLQSELRSDSWCRRNNAARNTYSLRSEKSPDSPDDHAFDNGHFKLSTDCCHTKGSRMRSLWEVKDLWLKCQEINSTRRNTTSGHPRVGGTSLAILSAGCNAGLVEDVRIAACEIHHDNPCPKDQREYVFSVCSRNRDWSST